MFVHITQVEGVESLTKGDHVEFEVRLGRKSEEAFNVRLLSQLSDG